jgi:hypothetical protein
MRTVKRADAQTGEDVMDEVKAVQARLAALSNAGSAEVRPRRHLTVRQAMSQSAEIARRALERRGGV